MRDIVRRSVLVATLAAVTVGGGCRTFHARKVEDPRAREDIGGIPIVVETPKYLKVTHSQVDYVLAYSEENKVSEGTLRRWHYQPLPPMTEVSTEVVSVGEVYAVDLERPFSGSANNGMTFPDGKQYPKSVSADIKDTTLTDVTAAVEKVVLPLVKPGAKSQAGDLAAAGVVSIKVREVVTRIEYYDVKNPTCLVKVVCPSGCDSRPAVTTAIPADPTLSAGK